MKKYIFVILFIAISIGIYSIYTQTITNKIKSETHFEPNSKGKLPAKHELRPNSPTTDNQLTINDCTQSLTTQEHSDFLKSKYIARIDQWLNTQNKQTDQNQQLVDITRAIGINSSEFKMLKSGQNESSNGEQQSPLTPEQIMAVMGYINKGQYNEFAANINAGIIPKDGQIIGEPILLTVIESDSNINAEQLSLLIQTGLSVTEADINYVIEHITSIDIVRLILSKSQDGLNSPELITLAIQALNPVSLEVILEQFGSEHVNYETAYDYLPFPFNQSEIAAAISIMNTLAAEGQLHVSPMGLAQLKLWYPQNRIAGLNLQITDNFDINLNKEQRELSRILMLSRRQILESNAMEEACFEQHQLTRNDTERFGVDLQSKLLTSDIPQGEIIGIARKKALAAFLKASEDNRSNQNEQTILFKGVFFQSYKKQWQQALNTVEKMIENEMTNEDPNTKQYYDFLLSQAILNQAPTSFIDELFEKGATLADNVILLLAVNNNVIMTQYLLNHGLNIHYTDEYGRNAVSQSVLSSNKEMFEFLTSYQVDIESKTQQFDSLNYALSNIDRSTAGVAFVEQLMFRGKVVDRSHRQQLELIQIEQPELYQRIEPLFY